MALIVKSFVRKCEYLELTFLLDQEPVEGSEVGPNSIVENIAVVKTAGDQCMFDSFSGVGGDPFENLMEQSEDVEAGGGD
ncbi:hypothetical protein NDU88_001942 [Pleurodeles waltl]|uniref:Uncharacterized protein n=1 Tax=Pleurodeles waltl TaxID=8319 RepID=A0AAV7WJV1_PLEWA|nr:hypothetical protein NDU88_001942 [Pleurodeles waltl]